MTHHRSALHELAERLQDADANLTTSIADILVAVLLELIEVELVDRTGVEPGERTGPSNATAAVPSGCPRPQATSGWGSQAAQRVVLPGAVSSRTSGSTRPVGGIHAPLHHRQVHEKGRRAGQGARGGTPGSPSRRCRGSARPSTTSPCWATVAWTVCRSSRCVWTRPTSTSADAAGGLQGRGDRDRVPGRRSPCSPRRSGGVSHSAEVRVDPGGSGEVERC